MLDLNKYIRKALSGSIYSLGVLENKEIEKKNMKKEQRSC